MDLMFFFSFPIRQSAFKTWVWAFLLTAQHTTKDGHSSKKNVKTPPWTCSSLGPICSFRPVLRLCVGHAKADEKELLAQVIQRVHSWAGLWTLVFIEKGNPSFLHSSCRSEKQPAFPRLQGVFQNGLSLAVLKACLFISQRCGLWNHQFCYHHG